VIKWHGWRRVGCAALHIGPLPGRKRIALYIDHGTWIETLAWFNGEWAARQVVQAIDELVVCVEEVEK
jgi:hypothetical protein